MFYYRRLPLWIFLSCLSLATQAAAPSHYEFLIEQIAPTSAASQSAMGQPIGPTDRVFVKNAHFYRVGQDLKANSADDSRIKFFGVNLSFAANFPAQAEADGIARRLRSLGFNAVRLHHLDSSPSVQPGDTRSILTDGPYPTLNGPAVARLKYFISALRSQGIYVNLNLHVGYRFRPDKDKVPPLTDAKTALPMSGPLHVFEQRLISLQTDYARQVIRALELKNESALAMIEINNESSLAHLWQSWQLDDWDRTIVGQYADELQRQWNQWIVARYGGIAAACQQWNDCDALPEGRVPLIAPRETIPKIPGLGARVANSFNARWNTVKTWLGRKYPTNTPDKTNTPRRLLDFMAFIADIDYRYLETLRDTIRAEAGDLVPITGTQSNFGGPLNFSSHASMDYTDEHFYLDHYNFPAGAWDNHDWRIKNSTLSGGELPHLLLQSLSRDSRKPFVLSEFNQPYPNQHRAELLPIVAALGAQQDWDGLFFFDYADGDRWPDAPTNFNLEGDPTQLAMVGQAARIFRQSWVPAAAQRVVLPLSKPIRLELAAQHNGHALRNYAVHVLKLQPESVLHAQVSVDPTGQTPYRSMALGDAGLSPLLYDAKQRRFTLRSEKVAGLFGFTVPDSPLDIGFMQWQPTSQTRSGFVAALVTSLDDKPLSHSEHLLLSIPGHAVGTQPGSFPRRPKRLVNYPNQSDWWTLEPDPNTPGKPSGSRVALGPVWMEGLDGRMFIRTQQMIKAVYPLDGSGQRRPPLSHDAVLRKPGGYEIALQADPLKRSPWYEIVAASSLKAPLNGKK